ncbi:hypothetical protein EJ02DRAFT_86846 [Clathrospora elynae]|uniref:Uncharacterized protein n=1 Tax=Clathrospora elynae TaxID=706981 RepID=A0A6A5S990_9PLEO|nr:hypothetical protein EJ02DRAFT_86846 [Clathrospora elynae]
MEGVLAFREGRYKSLVSRAIYALPLEYSRSSHSPYTIRDTLFGPILWMRNTSPVLVTLLLLNIMVLRRDVYGDTTALLY